MSFLKNRKRKALKFMKKAWKFATQKGIMGYLWTHSYFFLYPIAFSFWIKHLDKTWVFYNFIEKKKKFFQLKNDLKYLHPEVLHPTMKRYDSKHNSKFTFDLEEELKSLYVVHLDESIETKLQQNLSRATFTT